MDTTLTDSIEYLGRSLIHHGPFNQRIYVMKVHPDDMPGLVDKLFALARERGYTKITAKVGAAHTADFLAAGFRHEGYLPGFFPGEPEPSDAYYMGCFLDPARADTFRPRTVIEVINAALRKPCRPAPAEPPSGLAFRELGEEDAEAAAALFRQVFATYPFPIMDPDYIVQTMRSHIFYYGLENADGLVALASLETDSDNGTAELADFATLPAARGAGAAGFLIARMEEAAVGKGYRYGFTIARSTSFGMNIAFARAGYAYSGTLVNNTNIAGQVESMNLWYRTLTDPGPA